MDIIPLPSSAEAGGEIAESEQSMMLRAVAAAVPLATPGYVFTLAWLEDAFGMPPKPSETGEFEPWNIQRSRLIGAWQAEMLSAHRLHIEKRPRRGYVVIDPNETPFVAVKVARRELSRAIQQASDKIQYAPDELTDRQRQDRMDALAYLGKVDLAIRHARPKPPRPGRGGAQQIAG